jgi:hypothetical protein
MLTAANPIAAYKVLKHALLRLDRMASLSLVFIFMLSFLQIAVVGPESGSVLWKTYI